MRLGPLACLPLLALSLLQLGGWVAGLRPDPVPLPPPIPGPAPPAWADAFWAEARPLLEAHPGRVGLYLRELAPDTAPLAHRADERMYLASGVKLLVMVELFRQRERGDLSFDEKIRYRREDVRDGAPSMNKHRLGTVHTVDELLTYMVRDSDNAAADLLLKRVGADAVAANLRARGLIDIGPVVPLLDVRREVYRRLDPGAAELDAVQIRDVGWHPGFEPRLDLLQRHVRKQVGRAGTYGAAELDLAYRDYYALGRNHASMRTVGELYALMLRGELVSREADDEMLALLKSVWTCECRVDGDLPPDVTVAHKTGTQHQRVVDLAVIFLDDEDPLILTIAVEGERETGERLIQALARSAVLAARGARDAG